MFPYKSHSQTAELSKELQSLNSFFLEVGREVRGVIVKSLGKTKNEYTKAVTEILLRMLAKYKWIHQIWVAGENHPRMINNGHLDLILNPNLDGTGEEHESGIGPFGILISAKEKGSLLGPISITRFSIFIVIAMTVNIFIAEKWKLYQYKYQETKGDLSFIKEINKIPPGDQIITGDHPFDFTNLIPDQKIRERCSTLNIIPIDNGLVSNLSNFLSSGGALIYADYPETNLQSARLILWELGPISHLVSFAFGETRAAGGQNLISLQPINHNQRITSFIYTNNIKKQIDELAFIWPV